MERKIEIIELAGKQIEIRELMPRDIYNLANADEPFAEFEKIMLRCTGLKYSDLLDFTFSEIDELEKKVKEVNTAFFGRAQMLGKIGIINKLIKILIEKYKEVFETVASDYLNEVIKTLINTDGDTSSKP